MSTRRTSVNMTKPKLGNRERRSPRRTKTPSSNELKNKYKFSPKGKRKLDFILKGKKAGPLAGKLFYLDLNGFRYLTELKKTIEQLGGTIEEFFRKEVTYLVTNRGECGKSPSSQSAPSPGTPSPIPQTRSSSIKNYAAASPMSTDSPQGLDIQNQVSNGTTRGKSILQRSAGFKKGTTDILTNASTWGVTILYVDHVMKWISQLMLKFQEQQGAAKRKTASPSKRVSQTKLPKVVALQETYIKVEDLDFQYRPLVHEFKIWPEITFDGSNVCPFDPPRRRSSENNITKTKSGEGNIKNPPIHERPKNGYCECCEVRYVDLDTHLRGKQHKQFARKDTNYTSLDKAIYGGPKVEDLLREIQFKKSRSSSVREKKSFFFSCDETSDEVFLLSSPHSFRPVKNSISDHTPPHKDKDNLNNEERKKTSFVGVGEGYGSVQETDFVSTPCKSPTEKTKVILPESQSPKDGKSKEIESPKSGPVTRLQKASSNLSSPLESKHLSSRSKRESSVKITSIVKNTGNKGDSKVIKTTKRKSAELNEKCNQMQILHSSSKTFKNDNTVLENTDNEQRPPRRTTRKAISNLSTKSTKKENENEAEMRQCQDEDSNEIECKNKLRKNINNVFSNGVPGQSNKALLTENGAENITSNQHSNIKFQYSTVTKKEDVKKTNSESQRPIKKFATKKDECNQTNLLNESVSGDNGDNSLFDLSESPKNKKNKEKVRRNRISVDGINVGNHNVRRSKRKCDQSILYFSDRVKDEQQSKDSPPRLKTPPNNVSKDNHFAMCPGALIEDERTVTVRSARRRKSAISNCKISPITPCNLDGEYSVRSSCSENSEYLPSDLRYSSFDSSLGVVSKDVNHLVDRIGEVFHSDGDADNDNVVDADETAVDTESDTLSGCAEILKEHNASSSVECNVVVQENKQVENTELQVSPTFLNADAISGARGEDGDSGGNIKRKRNEEEEPAKSRKCKKLSVVSDSHSDEFVESGYTLEGEEKYIYRSSVAERVKIQRAIAESLQKCGPLLTVSEPLSSPQMQFTGRKRKSVLQSSPFAEITNTCKKKRERAKSEGRIRTNTRSIIRQSKNGRIQHPRSACLIPNDPFNFDDY